MGDDFQDDGTVRHERVLPSVDDLSGGVDGRLPPDDRDAR